MIARAVCAFLIPLLRETVRRAGDRRGYLFERPEDPVATLSQLLLLQSGQLTNAADVLFGEKVSQRHPQTRLRALCFSSDRAGDFLDEQLYEGPAFRLLENATAFLTGHWPRVLPPRAHGAGWAR